MRANKSYPFRAAGFHPPGTSIGPGMNLTEQAVTQYQDRLKIDWSQLEGLPEGVSPFPTHTNLKDQKVGGVGDGETPEADHFLQLEQVSGAGGGIVPPGRYLVERSIELEKPWAFAPGAVLVPAEGVTVTFNGSVDAGLYQWIDESLGGSVVLTNTDREYPEWRGQTGTRKSIVGRIGSPEGVALEDETGAEVLRVAGGAAVAPLADYGGEKFNVKTFGAVGDGVTDDWAAFQACIDHICNRGGGMLYIPRGVFRIDDTLVLSELGPRGIHIVGEGRHSSQLVFSANKIAIDVDTRDSRFQYHFNARDFSMYGPKHLGLPWEQSTGLHMRQVQKPWGVTNVFIIRFGTGLEVGIHTDLGVFNNCTFAYCATGARVVGVNSDFIKFYGCSVYSHTEYGFFLSSQRVALDHCFIGNEGDGPDEGEEAVFVQVAETPAKESDWGVGTVTPSSTADGIGTQITNCHFERGFTQTVPVVRLGLPGGTGTVTGVMVKDCRFGQRLNDLTHAIEIHRPSVGVQIKGNDFVNFQKAAIWADPKFAHDIEVEESQPARHLLARESLGAFRLVGTSPPQVKNWQQLRRWPGGGGFATYNSTYLRWLEDEVVSPSGCRDAALLEVLPGGTPGATTGIRHTVSGDDEVWEFSVTTKRDEANPLVNLFLGVRNSTTNDLLSEVRISPASYWKETRVSVYLPSGSNYIVSLASRTEGKAYHTPILVSKESRGSDWVVSPTGAINYLASNGAWLVSLPKGATWDAGSGSLSVPARGVVRERFDLTAASESVGAGGGSSTITLNNVVDLQVGDYIRPSVDTGDPNLKRVLMPSSGYRITALPGGNQVTISPGLLDGHRLSSGGRVQVYRYGKIGSIEEWA